MAKYYLSNKAVEDLSNIWNYTYDTWSENQANKYYLFLLDFCQKLSENPSFGKNYDKINKDLMGFKVSRHIIFYRILSQDDIEVVRILHSKWI